MISQFTKIRYINLSIYTKIVMKNKDLLNLESLGYDGMQDVLRKTGLVQGFANKKREGVMRKSQPFPFFMRLWYYFFFS